MLALLCVCAIVQPAPRPTGIVLGFVNHFPMIRHMDDRLGESGANVIIVRAPWALVEPREGQFDFRLIDEQLELAHRQRIQVVVLLEAGPAHAANVPWLVEKLRAIRHMQEDSEGRPVREPSPFSPLYRRYLARYVRTVVRYCSHHPRAHQVYGYNNGCEWWYPMHQSYGALAEEAFRAFLRRRYGTVNRLNAAWGAEVGAWSEVRAPRLAWLGSNRTNQGVMVPASGQLDACYATTPETHVPVRPGQRIRFVVEWRGEHVRSGGVIAEIAWLGEKSPEPIAIAQSALVTSGAPAVCDAAAPEGATRAWLLAKSMAVGTITFTSLRCTDTAGSQLARNPDLDPSRGGWQFIQWSAGEPNKVSHTWEATGRAVISYDSSLQLATPARWPLAAVSDWTAFRARGLAEFIDWFATAIRAADRRRPVVSYLTFAFANAFEWDYAQQMAIQLEHWAPRTPNQQILGMQLASGEGDPDSVTCALDMARKYGKPMWAIDLLDFTRGTALGESGLLELSKRVFDHGGTGIQYYCWWGTPHYNYLDLGLDALRQMLSAARLHADGALKQVCRADVALVMPRMPLYGPLPEPANDWADFMGWYKLLRHLDILADVYALEELDREDLRQHRLIIVPDCAYLGPTALRAICRAADRGTRVIQSGRFGLRDATGRRFPTATRPAFYRSFPRPLGAELLGDTYRAPTPTDTPPRLVCRKGSPRWESHAAQQAMEAIRSALRLP